MDLEPLNQLLAKEVNRQEFLAHMGATVLAVVGITGLLKAFTDPQAKSRPQSASFRLLTSEKSHQSSVTTGYGASKYGR